MRSLEFGDFIFAYFVDGFDCTGDFVCAFLFDCSDRVADFVCAFFFPRSAFISFAFISIVNNASMFLSLCQCFALSRGTVCVICLRTKCPHYHTAYAAVEPCRRQRPERSEDAAREQAAEGRMAKRFRPEIKKANESIRHATLQRKKNNLYLYRAG